jgi:hypothetical protein
MIKNENQNENMIKITKSLISRVRLAEIILSLAARGSLHWLACCFPRGSPQIQMLENILMV